MQGLKFAHLVHERTGATVYNFYIDMRTAYKAYDEFYQRVMEEGTLFVRGKVAEVTDAARYSNEKGKLIIQTEDTLAGKQGASQWIWSSFPADYSRVTTQRKSARCSAFPAPPTAGSQRNIPNLIPSPR